MTSPPDLFAAADFGLLPGLAPEELRQVHRRLVRRFHPDLGGPDGSAGVLARINAAYDAIRRQARATREAAEIRPPRWRPVATCEIAGGLRRRMEQTGLLALDDWLAVRHGLPRAPLLRRVACRFGVFAPVRRPGLLLPRRASLWPDALILHHDSAMPEGTCILILPALRVSDGLRLVPDGAVRAVLRNVVTPSRLLELPSDDARRYGLALRVDDRDLPVRLRFAARGEDAGAALCAAAGVRYRGVFCQCLPALPMHFTAHARRG